MGIEEGVGNIAEVELEDFGAGRVDAALGEDGAVIGVEGFAGGGGEGADGKAGGGKAFGGGAHGNGSATGGVEGELRHLKQKYR